MTIYRHDSPSLYDIPLNNLMLHKIVVFMHSLSHTAITPKFHALHLGYLPLPSSYNLVCLYDSGLFFDAASPFK